MLFIKVRYMLVAREARTSFPFNLNTLVTEERVEVEHIFSHRIMALLLSERIASACSEQWLNAIVAVAGWESVAAEAHQSLREAEVARSKAQLFTANDSRVTIVADRTLGTVVLIDQLSEVLDPVLMMVESKLLGGRVLRQDKVWKRELGNDRQLSAISKKLTARLCLQSCSFGFGHSALLLRRLAWLIGVSWMLLQVLLLGCLCSGLPSRLAFFIFVLPQGGHLLR